jgi:hypothetical protein
LVALLPNVKKLNGGASISQADREDAERAYIRRYAQEQGDRPERYNLKADLYLFSKIKWKLSLYRYYELVAIHGELEPLLDLRFKPTTHIKVRICCVDDIFERHLNVYQTTNELKVSLEQAMGYPAAKMRLFYVDADLKEVIGREEMRFPQKQLYSYNMQDGDEIYCEQKLSIKIHNSASRSPNSAMSSSI